MPSISADGRYVSFSVFRPELNPPSTPLHQSDVFVHDRVTKKTTLVSVHSNGTIHPELETYISLPTSSISADGRFIAFDSLAPDLVDNDKNNSSDVFVHDRLTKETTRVSVNSNGKEGECRNPSCLWEGSAASISANGRYVVFQSTVLEGLTPDQIRGGIFLHDRVTKETTRLNALIGDKEIVLFGYAPQISADGRFVAFTTDQTDLDSRDTNNRLDVYLLDRQSKKTVMVTHSFKDQGGFGSRLSADARYVAFLGGDCPHNYLYDRILDETTPLDLNTKGDYGPYYCGGKGYGNESASISADGRFAAFGTKNKLVDNDLNFFNSTYLRDRNFDSTHNADLAVTNTKKPGTLTKNATADYQFTVTNNGPDAVNVLSIQHMLSNGKLADITLSNGFCHRYTLLTICNVKDLPAGSSMTLATNVTALRNSVVQRLSISSGGRADPRPANNFLMVNTPVTK